jgi:nitrogen-specific signal transduction histidine kinase/ActR/RegA family two-component response regulator
VGNKEMNSFSKPSFEIDVKILSQLIAADNMLHIFTSSRKLGEFVTRALKIVPGVASCGICISGISGPLGDFKENQCRNCPVIHEDSERILRDKCSLMEQEDIYPFSLETPNRFFGFLVFKVDTTDKFVSYEPFVKNFINSTTINMENRWQKERLEIVNEELNTHRDHLEDIVKERTAELRHEITERQQAEEALRESEEKYRSMMEAMNNPVYICSKDFRVEYMNTAMIKRLGHDATGELCHSALHGLEGKCPWCIHEKVMGGESIKVEVVSPMDNKIFHVSNSPISHTPGSISKLTVFRDITGTRRMEEKLRQAQKIESIGTLAGGIAHDFNNILFPIIGMSELLLEDLPSNSLEHENAQVILEAGQRGGELVKQILAFSRQSEHKLIPVRVQQVLKEVLKLSRSTIPSNIELAQDIQSECGLVLADPTQLHQIAMNLITNAYHAVQESGGKILVELREKWLGNGDVADTVLKPGHYVMLTISDTGIGIDPAVIGRIFDPYFTTKEHGKGTGLGLAVAYGIIKDHHGEVKVYSEVGKGTTFNIFIPLIEKNSDIESFEETVTIHSTGHERILLVDDEELIVRIETQMLERLGYKVTSRISSIDALEAFRANPDAIDLVLTDMTMPNMTGDQLAKKLISIKPDIPIIVCTGFSEKLNAENAKASGISGFLMKPVVKSDIAQMVRKVLDEAKG